MNGQIIERMASAEYHADPAQAASLSASIGKVFMDKSPYHAWLEHPKLNPDYAPKESSTFDLGTAAHDLILEGGTPRICVIDPQEYRSKPTKADPEGSIPKGWTNNSIREARDLARSNGLTPILPWDDAVIRHMKKAAMTFVADSEIAGIFDDGKPEQTLIWQDSGIWCRARLDWLTTDRRVILDYKSSASAQPHWFSRQIANIGYDFQAAFYLRGLKACGHPNAQFLFLAQEVDAPHACSLHGIAPSMMAIAEEKVEQAIRGWKRCLETGKWPAYDNRVHWAEATAWQMQQMEELAEAA